MLYNFGGGYNMRTPFSPVFGQGFLQNMTPLQREYYQNTPEAVFGGYMQGLQQQGASPMFQKYADKWLPDAWRMYQYQQGQDVNGTSTFMDYLNGAQGNLGANFKREAHTQRPMTRPTRLLYGR